MIIMYFVLLLIIIVLLFISHLFNYPFATSDCMQYFPLSLSFGLSFATHMRLKREKGGKKEARRDDVFAR